MLRWRCPQCKKLIAGKRAVANHIKNLWKPKTDPTRCDLLCTITLPWTVPTTEEDTPTVFPVAPVAVVAAPASLIALARRERESLELRRLARASYTICANHRVDARGCRDMASVQAQWIHYKEQVLTKCSDKFWDFFLPMHTFSAVAISTALQAARKVFM